MFRIFCLPFGLFCAGIMVPQIRHFGLVSLRRSRKLRQLHYREQPSAVFPANLEIRSLTPDLWPALEDLFGRLGACNGCWCMYWRIGSAYRKQAREANKASFFEIVKRGPPPGLIAFDGDVAAGWGQLTPRDALPWLERVWRLRRVDDLPVWSISCFYVRKVIAGEA